MRKPWVRGETSISAGKSTEGRGGTGAGAEPEWRPVGGTRGVANEGQEVGVDCDLDGIPIDNRTEGAEEEAQAANRLSDDQERVNSSEGTEDKGGQRSGEESRIAGGGFDKDLCFGTHTLLVPRIAVLSFHTSESRSSCPSPLSI
jgi:hypothetical protein